MRPYTRLTLKERYYIYLWHSEQKLGYREIALRLGRAHMTIYNELKNNRRRPDLPIDKSPYDPEYADWAAAERRSEKIRGRLLVDGRVLAKVKKAIEERHWSIPMIAHGMSRTPCEATLYKYQRLGITALAGYQKQKRRKPAVSIAKMMAGNRQLEVVKEHSIEKRPNEINIRRRHGHWEMDCIDSPKGIASSLLVFVERKSRYTEIIKITSKRRDQMLKGIKQFLTLQEGNVKSITTDRGHEFTNFDVVSYLTSQGIDIYYAHAYSPSEKGTIERINRDIRRYCPKKASLAPLTSAFLQQVKEAINDYPREVLHWTSANRAFTRWQRKRPSMTKIGVQYVERA